MSNSIDNEAEEFLNELGSSNKSAETKNKEETKSKKEEKKGGEKEKKSEEKKEDERITKKVNVQLTEDEWMMLKVANVNLAQTTSKLLKNHLYSKAIQDLIKKNLETIINPQ